MGLVGSLVRLVSSAHWVRLSAANRMLQRYNLGSAIKVTQLNIDRDQKKITLELALEGEVSPVNIAIGNYDFTPESDGTGTMKIFAIDISKPWMQAIAKNLILNKPLKIPADLAQWAAMVL